MTPASSFKRQACRWLLRNRACISGVLGLLVATLYLLPTLVGRRGLLLDPLDHMVTFVRFAYRANLIRSGILPFWDTKPFTGMSFIETVPTTHVLNLQPYLMALLGNDFGYKIAILLFLAASSHGMFLLANRHLGLSVRWALLCGFSLTFGPFLANAFGGIFSFCAFAGYYFHALLGAVKADNPRQVARHAAIGALAIGLCFYTQEPRYLEFFFWSTVLLSGCLIVTARPDRWFVLRRLVLYGAILSVLAILLMLPVLVPMASAVASQARLGSGEALPAWMPQIPAFAILARAIGLVLPVSTTVLQNDLRVTVLGTSPYFYYVHPFALLASVVLVAKFRQLPHLIRAWLVAGIVLYVAVIVCPLLPGVMRIWTLVFRQGRFLETDLSFFFLTPVVFLGIRRLLATDPKSVLPRRLWQGLASFQAVQIAISVAVLAGLLAARACPTSWLLWLYERNRFAQSFSFEASLDLMYTRWLSLLIAWSVLALVLIGGFRAFFRKRGSAPVGRHRWLMAGLLALPFCLSWAYCPFDTEPDRFARQSPATRYLQSLTILDRAGVAVFNHRFDGIPDIDRRELIGVGQEDSLQVLEWIYDFGLPSTIHHVMPRPLYEYVRRMQSGFSFSYWVDKRFFFYPVDNNYFHLTGVRYFLSQYRVFAEPFVARGQYGPYTLYENTKALPRFHFVSRVVPTFSLDEALEAVEVTDYEDLRSTAFVSGSDGLAETRFEPEGSTASLLRYSPNQVVFQASCDRPQMLVLTDTFDRNWRCTVSGKPVPVLRVNGVFRGVQLPPGEHNVVFTYSYPGFGAMAAVAAIVLVICLTAVFTPVGGCGRDVSRASNCAR